MLLEGYRDLPEAGGAAVGQGGGECHLLLRAGPAGSTLWLCQGPSREEQPNSAAAMVLSQSCTNYFFLLISQCQIKIDILKVFVCLFLTILEPAAANPWSVTI